MVLPPATSSSQTFRPVAIDLEGATPPLDLAPMFVNDTSIVRSLRPKPSIIESASNPRPPGKLRTVSSRGRPASTAAAVFTSCNGNRTLSLSRLPTHTGSEKVLVRSGFVRVGTETSYATASAKKSLITSTNSTHLRDNALGNRQSTRPTTGDMSVIEHLGDRTQRDHELWRVGRDWAVPVGR